MDRSTIGHRREPCVPIAALAGIAAPAGPTASGAPAASTRPLFVARTAVLAALATTASPAIASAQDRPLTADFADVYRVGGIEAADWAQFSTSGAVAFDEAGNLVILDDAAHRVIVLDRTGGLVRVVGREGQGPGEFHEPSDLIVWRDGRFAVPDAGHQALQVFGEDGRLLHFVRMEGQGGSPLAGLTRFRGSWRADPGGEGAFRQGVSSALGKTVGAFAQLFGAGAESEGVDDRGIERVEIVGDTATARPVLHAWRVPRGDDPDGLSVNDLADQSRLMTSMVGMLNDRLYYEPDLLWDVLPDGTIAYSDSSAYAVRIVGADGAATGVLRRPHEPEAVDSRIRSRTIARALRNHERNLEGTSEDVLAQLPGLPGAFREQIETRDFFAEVPIVRDLRATWEGALWIQRRGKEPWDDRGAIDVFDRDREYLGTFADGTTEMPDAFGPDGLVAFWELDELDVPIIVVRRLPTAVR